jgi:hypothetical protein
MANAMVGTRLPPSLRGKVRISYVGGRPARRHVEEHVTGPAGCANCGMWFEGGVRVDVGSVLCPRCGHDLMGGGLLPCVPDGAVHAFFDLTYATHLVLPRSVLQSMPYPWQERLVALMRELDETIDWRQDGICISRRDAEGKFLRDEFRDYERGRRRVPWRARRPGAS